MPSKSTIHTDVVTRCLSVREPWAWAITTGVRPVDIRSWGTPYRGRIAIHASTDRSNLSAAGQEEIEWLWENAGKLDLFQKAIQESTPGGYIVGSVELVGVVDTEELGLEEYEQEVHRIASEHDLDPGLTYGWSDWDGNIWILATPRRYAKPIKANGKLRLWTLDAKQRRQVAAAERKVVSDDGQAQPRR
jgi:hypothetical protein